MLLPAYILQNMPQESTNIFVKGLHDKYIQRPDFLESLCLADFAATFEFSKTSRISRQRENSDNKGDDRALGGYMAKGTSSIRCSGWI